MECELSYTITSGFEFHYNETRRKYENSLKHILQNELLFIQKLFL